MSKSENPENPPVPDWVRHRQFQWKEIKRAESPVYRVKDAKNDGAWIDSTMKVEVER